MLKSILHSSRMECIVFIVNNCTLTMKDILLYKCMHIRMYMRIGGFVRFNYSM